MKNSKSISAHIFMLCLTLFSLTYVFAQSPIPAGAKLETLKSGFLQPEGPVWVDSLGVLFSDIQGNKIYRWSPVDSALTTYLYPSDSSNGLTLDLHGRLILTQMEKRRVSRQETDGTITPLDSTFNGKKLNSPNDVVVKSDGSIFFTDPDFNIPSNQKRELTFRGIYRISPSGTLSLLDTSLSLPNGICFSPDESQLYVNDSQKRIIYVWDVINDSTISYKKVLFTIPGTINQDYADGMKVDPAGNIYCAGTKGIWVISPTGVCLDTIVMPINPSNCAWGDADRKTLYITGKYSLYRIRLAVPTGVKEQGLLPAKTFKLMDSYPNPFNPSTIIQFQTIKYELVTMKVFDSLGRQVAILMNEFKRPGTYTIEWNASGMPSGLYFCQLQSGNEIQSKKLVLTK